jgi:hypothetical protein
MNEMEYLKLVVQVAASLIVNAYQDKRRITPKMVAQDAKSTVDAVLELLKIEKP